MPCVFCANEHGAPVDDEGEIVQMAAPSRYLFSNESITLNGFHKVTCGAIIINIRECKQYITKGTDWAIFGRTGS